MITIYRVEHKAYGNGPYMASLDHPRLREFARELRFLHTDASHPNWREDFEHDPRYAKLEDRGEIYSGFTTLVQLTRWFEYARRLGLKRIGYVIRKYSVPDTDICDSLSQAVFLKDNAKDCGIIDWDELGR